jgi:hypothetical protein
VHDHLCKWGHWKPEKLPHDVPHYMVAPRLLCDFYKCSRAEVEVEEACVRQCTEVVEDLEGLAQ